MKAGAAVLRTAVDLTMPCGLLVAAAFLMLTSVPASESWSSFLVAFPYFALGCGFILGWRFDQSRLIAGVLALALADRGLAMFAGDPFMRGFVAALLPLNLALLSLTRERGLFGLSGAFRIGLVLTQAPLLLVLRAPEYRSLLEPFRSPLANTAWTEFTWIPQPALAVFAVAAVYLAIRFLYHRNPVEAGLFWALGAAFIGLHVDLPGGASTTYLATAQLVLCVAVIEQSYAMAYRDELTGLPARRALDETLDRLHGDYTLAMVDVDHFKKFNDRYGHDVGDQVLRMIAGRLARVGGGGRAFRYGGEEFTIVFKRRNTAEALQHLEDVRKTIASSRFTVRGQSRPKRKPKKPKNSAASGDTKQARVTVSIGVATRDDRDPTPEAVIRLADRNLYKAKRAGRNRTKT